MDVTSRVPYWLLAILVGALTFAVGTQGPADAYVLNGCKFPGSNPTITYEFQTVTSSWQLSFTTAKSKWNAKTALNLVAGSAQTIPVQDADYPDSWWGLASGGCAGGGNKTWYVTSECPGKPCVKIQFNLRTDDGLDGTDR